MAQPRPIPDLDIAAILPVMGPFALPLLMTHNMMTAYARLSQFWVDLAFVPHPVATPSTHDLPVPDALDDVQPHIDLFA